ncbi:xanthine dehydrogenase accessory protein XdhC [Enterococcus moraviensis ATCC BAA-383]|uniref:Xanthine dehydrogenase accessory protein XdhC n=1 Tax=Enterococcus moraviensis ATCC BAA-383 TaxID=1158609 RepID=R2QU32_9ENTE|nr:XdhC/CoxI family protein [Enterococcus moraviensis]EOH98843.1 xanthine dehydrogenase accessory protein XdhC [Enterococcus moraviensis ATCC BAA-383]EOT71982.1 xanthine dehydrogenase accessory protein XdhC [Enterococcus moraviensis ATCC BAA-383]
MKELFLQIIKAIRQKEDTVLVTVIESSGSTPRGAGAQMLVGKSGRINGTIGGGAVEFRGEKIAKEIVKSHLSRTEKFILAPNDVADLGMICGGDVELFFQYLSWQDANVQEICGEIIRHFECNQQCWLIMEVNAEGVNDFGLYSQKNGLLGDIPAELEKMQFKTGLSKAVVDGKVYSIASLLQTGKVFVFGGGHVAQAVIPILKTLDFYCVVLDDREHFLTESIFPDADQRMVIDLGNIDASIQITEADYAIVMTRGHQFDFLLAKQLLNTPAHYIGVMGSKQKIATQIRKLKECSFSMSDIARINMPIGLKIKAETPAELAISVAGELIEKRATAK